MKKKMKLSVYVCSAALLLILTGYTLAVNWGTQQPDTPAFAKLHADSDLTSTGLPARDSALHGGCPASCGPQSASAASSLYPEIAEAAETEPLSPAQDYGHADPAESPGSPPAPTTESASTQFAPPPPHSLSPSSSPSASAGTQGDARKPEIFAGDAAVSLGASVHETVYQPVYIPVLNYHSVSVHPGNIVTIRPEKFEEQMRYLKDNDYHPLRLEEFISILEHKQAAPVNPVLLTFDDGYTDNLETAMPIMRKYGFTATLFMSPGMVETPGYLNWDQVKELHKAGWDIEPHGMTHTSLRTLNVEKQTYEITEARKQIEEHLNVRADVFCYPYGEYNKETLKILSKHGFRYAFTIDQGFASSEQHPFKLKRIFVNGEEKLASFIAKLRKGIVP